MPLRHAADCAMPLAADAIAEACRRRHHDTLDIMSLRHIATPQILRHNIFDDITATPLRRHMPQTADY